MSWIPSGLIALRDLFSGTGLAWAVDFGRLGVCGFTARTSSCFIDMEGMGDFGGSSGAARTLEWRPGGVVSSGEIPRSSHCRLAFRTSFQVLHRLFACSGTRRCVYQVSALRLITALSRIPFYRSQLEICIGGLTYAR